MYDTYFDTKLCIFISGEDSIRCNRGKCITALGHIVEEKAKNDKHPVGKSLYTQMTK